MLLDEVLPEYTIRSRHERRIDAPPARVFAAAKAVRGDEIALVDLLFFVRSVPARLLGAFEARPREPTPMLDGMVRGGFVFLGERENEEVVVGMVGQPWKPNAMLHRCESREAFEAFAEPGNVKVAMHMLVEPDGRGGALLKTETRILCLGPDATRTFRRYWRVIGMGSGLIRVMWLRAIARRALAAAA